MLTSGSSSPHLQLPLLETQVTVCCKVEETTTDKFIFVHFKFKTWDFYSRSPNPFLGGSRICSNAKGPHFISRERKQINIHDNYGHRVIYNKKIKKDKCPRTLHFYRCCHVPTREPQKAVCGFAFTDLGVSTLALLNLRKAPGRTVAF